MDKSTNPIGIINIDKPPGITSHDVVARIRKLADIKRVGHTGTLDPFATGILLVAIGPATRLIQFTHNWEKEYSATFIFGASSDTDDITGEISKFQIPNSKQITKHKIQNTLKQFIGNIQQIPPAYSAVKIKGKKLYEHARIGENVVANARPVTIHEIKIISYDYPELKLHIRCSTGTYIRALARDLGTALNTGSYVSQLRRTKIGKFHESGSIKLEKLSTDNLKKGLNTVESMIWHLPSAQFPADNVAQLEQGRKLPYFDNNIPANSPLSLFDQNKNLIGIGEYDSLAHLLSPRIILP